MGGNEMTEEDGGESMGRAKCEEQGEKDEKPRSKEFRRKVLRTLCIGASFMFVGFQWAMRGPSFLDLQIITDTNIVQASWFFVAVSVGYLVGSLLAGAVYDAFNKTLLLLLFVVCMGVCLIALPWCAPYPAMIAIHLVVSVFTGGLDTAANAEILRIWGKDGQSAMQFLHFTFAFGGILGPLTTEPFLTPIPEDSNSTMNIKDTNNNFSLFSTNVNFSDRSLNTSTNFSYASTLTKSIEADVGSWNTSGNVTNASNFTTIIGAQALTTDVHYAYVIVGCLTLLTSLPFACLLMTDQRQKQKRRRQDDDEQAEPSFTKQPLPPKVFAFVLSTFCVMYFMYCAVEDTFSAFLTTFVVRHLHWSKAKGAFITSTFWVTLTVGRFLSIFIVRVLNSSTLLLISGVSIFLSLTSFLAFSSEEISSGVWISSVAAGASMSAFFATGFSWMEEKFLRVTGMVSAAILVASSSGTLLNPIFLGYLMEHDTPLWFAYLLVGQGFACLCIFLFLLASLKLYIEKRFVVQKECSVEITAPSLSGPEHCEKTRDDHVLEPVNGFVI